jgi:hypothetical protein
MRAPSLEHASGSVGLKVENDKSSQEVMTAGPELNRCFDVLKQVLDTRDTIRNRLIERKVRLALAQRAPDQQPAQELQWEGEPATAEDWLPHLKAGLEAHNGRVLLHSCQEFPCIFGLQIAAEKVDIFMQWLSVPEVDSLYLQRVGIEDDGEVIHFLAVASNEGNEGNREGTELLTRIEYRSLLLNQAYQEENQ